VRRRRRLVTVWSVLTLLLTLAGCQGPSTPQQPRVQESDPATLARQAFDRKDWAAAAPLLRTAIQRDTGSLELHYKLAITASYLSLVDEAVTEFEWVVAHAAEGSEEMRVAREWLTAAKSRDVTTVADGSRRPGSATRAEEGRTGDSGISGTVTWAESGRAPEIKRRMQLHLIALPGQQSVEEQRFTIRTDEDGRYAFTKVPPGVYKLTNTVAGPPLWRLRVTIAPGRETPLDLNNANSVTSRDDFPDKG
jgi:hypothetical protein